MSVVPRRARRMRPINRVPKPDLLGGLTVGPPLSFQRTLAEHAFALHRSRAGASRDIAGTIKISTSEWFATHALTVPISGLTADHPELTVEILTDSSLVDLSRREADLACRFQPFTTASIVQRRLTTVRYGLFATPEFLNRVGPIEHAGSAVRLIGMDSAFDGLADIAWMRGLFPQATFAVRSNSRDVQARACSEGLGVAVLPRILGASFGLVQAYAEEPPSRVVWIGYHHDLKQQPRLRVLIDHLCKEVPVIL